MPAPKKPTTFDAHVGAVVNGLARPHGGRPYVAEALKLSVGTVNRRMSGEIGFTVKEMRIVADALNTTPEAIVDQALRNYGDGDAEAGWQKLRSEDDPAQADADTATNVGDPHEDDYEYTPGGPKKSEHALAANRRPKKVDSAPYAE